MVRFSGYRPGPPGFAKGGRGSDAGLRADMRGDIVGRACRAVERAADRRAGAARMSVRAAFRAVLAQPCRFHLCAGAVALVAAAMVLGAGGHREEGTTDQYRPGGMEVRRAAEVLSRRARAVDGCLRVGETDRSSPERDELSRVFAILGRSATGRAVLRQAQRRDVHVCIDERTDLLAYYFAGVRVVGVSAELSQGGKIVFLAHELAHVPQHPAYSDNRFFPASDLVLLRRVREAVAEAVATRIAWELRENGYPHAWEEKVSTSYGDVARAFEEAMTADRSGGGALRATRAAFDRWFAAPWRLNVYDRMTVDHLERISGDELGLVPPRRFLTHGFLEGIAWLDGRNFLAATAGRRLTDPYYAGNLSIRNAARLERVLDLATFTALPFDPAPMAGVAS